MALAASVVDPEIPTVTIEDLGILRGVVVEGKKAVVTITPTYSGCPAMDTIRRDIESVLELAGWEPEVRLELSPAWTTEWVTDAGRQKLAAVGIAPPGSAVKCPLCLAVGPRQIAEFGSTACKALMVCSSCGEPFDRFKVLK